MIDVTLDETKKLIIRGNLHNQHVLVHHVRSLHLLTRSKVVHEKKSLLRSN